MFLELFYMSMQITKDRGKVRLWLEDQRGEAWLAVNEIDSQLIL